MPIETLKFKGMSISKENFELKYNIQLSSLEWGTIVTLVSKSWEESILEVKLLSFRHIKEALGEIGYKPMLNESEISFEKIE